MANRSRLSRRTFLGTSAIAGASLAVPLTLVISRSAFAQASPTAGEVPAALG